MSENINGYVLIGDFSNNNAGMSRWAFARKDGQEVFIKEFLSPVYPVETGVLPPSMVARRTKICNKFVEIKTELYDALNKCNTGNVVGILDFFRFNAKYYIVTEKISSTPLSMEEIAAMTVEQKHLILKIIVHCVRTLHEHHIVHSDIKHDNILFKKTPRGKYVAKLIDFDASFLENSLPNPDGDFCGDMVYYAPESFKYMVHDIDKIDTKIDTFALGLLFHQYFTGQLPYFNSEEKNYAFEYVLDGNVLKCDKEIPLQYAKIIESMLLENPESRPSLNEVFKWLEAIDGRDRGVSPPPPPPQPEDQMRKHGFRSAGEL